MDCVGVFSQVDPQRKGLAARAQVLSAFNQAYKALQITDLLSDDELEEFNSCGRQVDGRSAVQ